MAFSHWLEHGLILDGKKTSFKYDKASHYQIGNRGPAIISDTYSVYEIEKLYSLLKTPQPYWPDEVHDVVEKIKSGKLKISRGVVHWHRHHDKLKDPAAFKLTETYYMIVYAASQDGDIPVLEITHNSVAKYKRDALFFDVERLLSKAESGDGLFRAADSVVVKWQELPETIGISRKNIFWAAADLEASNAAKEIYYFSDETDPVSNLDLFLLYSPDQHAGAVLTQFMNVILNRGESGLPTFSVETINGANHYNYFYRENGWTEVDVGHSGIEMPNEDGDAFNKFLEFIAVSIPGMVSYLGDGNFSVIMEPLGALVVETGTRTSPMVGIGLCAIDVGKIIGGPALARGAGVAAARAVDNHDGYKGKKYTESAENQRKITALNLAGFLCGPVTPPGETSDPLPAQRVSDCRDCVSASEAYDNYADGARDGVVVQAGTRCADYAENEAYIDSIEDGVMRGCSNFM